MSKRFRIALLVTIAMVAACGPSLRVRTVANPVATDELWEDRRNVAALDLFHGVGGEALTPDPNGRFTFVAEDTLGASPGYTVRDESDREWDVKLGIEAPAEVVVSRLLWAVGFHQPTTYLVPAGWRVSGAPPWITYAAGPQGAARFRPNLPGEDVVGEWSWYDNPFVGTREFRGLVLANFILSNWDFKASNNKIYEVDRNGTVKRQYVVRDLGASLGKEAPKLGWLGLRVMRGSKNNLEDFEETRLSGTGDNRVVDYSGLDGGLFEDVTREDVAWVSRLFSRLSERQLDDAFRAGGYPTEIRARYVRKIREKVTEGVSAAPAATP